MKVLGIQTEDFSASYDLVQALRARRIPFVTLAPGADVPPHVGAVITTADEVARVAHPNVVVFSDPEATLAEATRLLEGILRVRTCVIGVDPGERPGVAVLADGRVIRLVHARAPEAVRAAVDAALASVPAERFIVRVGNGAPTFRDRILNTLAGLRVPIEIVNEAHSTPSSYHGNAERDTAAATNIALTPGFLVKASDVGPVRPSEGELRDIQRKSRLASEGKITIRRSLARGVALGRFTLDEAVQRQLGRA